MLLCCTMMDTVVYSPGQENSGDDRVEKTTPGHLPPSVSQDPVCPRSRKLTTPKGLVVPSALRLKKISSYDHCLCSNMFFVSSDFPMTYTCLQF